MMARRRARRSLPRGAANAAVAACEPAPVAGGQTPIAAELRDAGVRIDPRRTCQDVDAARRSLRTLLIPLRALTRSTLGRLRAGCERGSRTSTGGPEEATTLRAERLTRVLYGEGIDLSATAPTHR
jgi:hypothetical protein